MSLHHSLHQPLTDSATGFGATTPEHPHSALARRWYQLRHGDLAPPGPDPASGTEQLLSLLAIAEEALAVVPESSRMVAACGTAAMVPVTIGRRCGEQLRTISGLRRRLEELNVSAEFATTAERLLRLLSYHQYLVHQAIGLAFTARPQDRSDAYRARLGGSAELADPTAELIAIRDELRSWCREVLPLRRHRQPPFPRTPGSPSAA